MKKLLASLLSLVMMFSVAGCSEDKKDDAKDEDVKDKAEKIVEETIKVEPMSGTCGDNLTFELAEDGTLTISGTGEMYEYYDTYFNKQREDFPWEERCEDIHKLVIKQGVETINARAFMGCQNLEEITFPASIREIQDWTFAACRSLKTVNMPDKVDESLYIGADAFNQCAVTEIELPIGTKSIHLRAFSYCALKTFVIPDTVTSFDLSIVGHCRGLERMHIPTSVTEITDTFGQLDAGVFGGDNTKIYGEEGSYAQTYAEENGIAFVAE